MAGVVVAGAIAGCSSSPSDAVTMTLKQYLRAVATGNGQLACDQLAPAAQRTIIGDGAKLGTSTCATTFEKVAPNLTAAQKKAALSKANSLKVTVRVTGDRATAQVAGGSGAAQLQNVNGQWRLSGAATQSTR